MWTVKPEGGWPVASVSKDADTGPLFENPPPGVNPEVLKRLRQMYEAGGWVLVGDINRGVHILDVKTGKILWETRLGTSVQGFPVT